MHNLTVTKDHQYIEKVSPESMSWNLIMYGACRAPYSCLIQREKDCCRGDPATQQPKMARCPVQRPDVFNQRSQWDQKKGQQFTLLKRITSYKSVNSESIGVSVLSHRVPSWGSCHLVDSTWVTHLNWNNFSNFVVECIGRDNDPKTKT